MGHHRRRPPLTGRRRERGAALVEMALVVGLLALLLFGTIAYGVTLSYRQSLTQAANEAARAAAVAPFDLAGDRAREAADRAIGAQGTLCNQGDGLTCTFLVEPCNGGDGRSCMTVRLVYDLAGSPRVGSIPIIDATMPDELRSTAVVELNDP